MISSSNNWSRVLSYFLHSIRFQCFISKFFGYFFLVPKSPDLSRFRHCGSLGSSPWNLVHCRVATHRWRLRGSPVMCSSQKATARLCLQYWWPPQHLCPTLTICLSVLRPNIFGRFWSCEIITWNLQEDEVLSNFSCYLVSNSWCIYL